MYDKFAVTLREALKEGIVELPATVSYSYNDLPVYRGVIARKNGRLEREDFFSQAERGLPGYRADNIGTYSCSVFRTIEALKLAYHLPRKRKGIAFGTLNADWGPIDSTSDDGHIHWYRYENATPEETFKVIDDD